MSTFVALLPLLAAAFGIPQFAPQIVRVRRLNRSAGVSWSWAALTCVNNVAWFVYFLMSRFWTSLLPSGSVALLSGTLMVLLSRQTGVIPRRPAGLVALWSAALIIITIFLGRIGLGTALALAFLVQVAPSIWLAARSVDMAGASPGTWLLICGEQLSWGLFGVYASDIRLIILGITGIVAGGFVLVRIGQATSRSTTQPLTEVR